jgi:hypothetical protein
MMRKEVPIIRIRNAWLLQFNASYYLNELWGEGKSLRSDEEYEKIARSYIEAWLPYESKVLKGVSELLNLEFRQNIIDVHIAPWFSAFSEPLIIGVKYKPDQFIGVLTHELIHKLLTDNTLLEIDFPLIPEWEKLFGKNHNFGALVHIPVHAVLKYIFIDILKQPERLKRDIEMSKKNNATDYIAAWDYVEKNDYLKIIKDLKESYAKLAANADKK